MPSTDKHSRSCRFLRSRGWAQGLLNKPHGFTSEHVLRPHASPVSHPCLTKNALIHPWVVNQSVSSPRDYPLSAVLIQRCFQTQFILFRKHENTITNQRSQSGLALTFWRVSPLWRRKVLKLTDVIQLWSSSDIFTHRNEIRLSKISRMVLKMYSNCRSISAKPAGNCSQKKGTSPDCQGINWN